MNRKEKIELLKGIESGNKSIRDLDRNTVKIYELLVVTGEEAVLYDCHTGQRFNRVDHENEVQQIRAGGGVALLEIRTYATMPRSFPIYNTKA